MFKKTCFLAAIFFLNSCTCSILSVRTEYLSHENLASYHVGTPDPLLENPPIGQRLIVNWTLPQDIPSANEMYIEVTIRFRNKEEIRERFPICKKSGRYIYTLLNERYIETDGIQTYKIELKQGDCIVEEWRHQLWVELITFNKEDTPNESFDFDEDE